MMKKNLIAAAALFAVAGAAQAQVAVYGLIDMCYGKSVFSEWVASKADFHSGGDNGSSECNSTTRVGVKGSTDVGSGVKANFKFETAGIKSNGAVGEPGQDFFRRGAWASLSGSFGEVRLGRQNSVVFDTMVDYDFNGASNGVSSSGYTDAAVWMAHDSPRQNGTLKYISPNMNGATFMASYKPKGDGTSDNFAASVKYSVGPLSVAVATESKVVATGFGSKTFSSLAGTYDFKVAKVMLGYANGGDWSAGGTGKGLSVGVVAPVAGFNVGAQYANNTDAAAKMKGYELFVNKEIFKNTYGYVEFGDWKTSLAANPYSATFATKASAFAVGAIFVF